MSRGRSGISSAVWDIASAPWDNIGFQRLQPQYRPSESDGLDRCELELKKALTEIPPPTVAEVAERLGISLHSLRRACPELCTRLSSCRFDRRQFQFATVEKALRERSTKHQFHSLNLLLDCVATQIHYASPIRTFTDVSINATLRIGLQNDKRSNSSTKERSAAQSKRSHPPGTTLHTNEFCRLFRREVHR